MNEYSVSLTAITVAVCGIGAIFGNPLVPRIRAFLPVARKRERQVGLEKVIANERIEELLMVFPGRNTDNLSNSAHVPVEYASRSVLSPFGDW